MPIDKIQKLFQTAKQKPRIVIYGAGQFGQYITRFAVQKGWPVIAAFNRAGDKVGQDMGVLAGVGTMGVTVQDCDTASYDGLNADIGIVAISDQLATNYSAYERLMNAGLNVICHACGAYFPYGTNGKVAGDIDALAKRNNVTFTGTGIWDMSRIWSGILLLGPCTEITSLFHKSITDVQRVGTQKQLKTILGIGMTTQEYEEQIASALGLGGGMYQTIPQHVLTASGFTVTKVTETRVPVVFDKAIYSPVFECELAAGVCVGTRYLIEVETAQGVNAVAHIELRLFDDGETEHTLWKVEGKPSSSIRVERDDSGHATAATLFNRIPDVIDAPAGIQEIYKLGVLKHTALV